MADPRVEAYAKLLVETCLDVQPGWQVLVTGSPLARPLIEELSRAIGRRSAYALTRMTFSGYLVGYESEWLIEAPEELVGTLAPIEAETLASADAVVVVVAPENTRAETAIPAERFAALQGAARPALERLLMGELVWVGCQYPVPALAQEAGMTLRAFEDFLYGACLLDWDAERARMERIKERFDAASEVRIVGEGTDLVLGLEGREGKVDAGGANMPGGEVFYSPVEDTAHGEIAFTEFPAVYQGRELRDIRLRFEHGVVVNASARTEEAFLLETLDTDDGSRRLGELGLGCNPGITRHMKNTLFDEKIYGTVHLALGNGFPQLGGANVSAVHWDIVKDLRHGGQLFCDGELVQSGGEWELQ